MLGVLLFCFCVVDVWVWRFDLGCCSSLLSGWVVWLVVGFGKFCAGLLMVWFN